MGREAQLRGGATKVSPQPHHTSQPWPTLKKAGKRVRFLFATALIQITLSLLLLLGLSLALLYPANGMIVASRSCECEMLDGPPGGRGRAVSIHLHFHPFSLHKAPLETAESN